MWILFHLLQAVLLFEKDDRKQLEQQLSTTKYGSFSSTAGGLIVKPGWHKRGRLGYQRVAEDDYDDAVFNVRYSVFAIDHGMDDKVACMRDIVQYTVVKG